jgi:hypothetical protein
MFGSTGAWSHEVAPLFRQNAYSVAFFSQEIILTFVADGAGSEVVGEVGPCAVTI